MKRLARATLRGLACALFWALCWAGVALAVNRPVVLPGPLSVVRRVAQLLTQAEFYGVVGRSLSHILLGFAAGCTVALLCAVLCFRFRVLDLLFRPALSCVRATPVASFIILALMFIGKVYVPGFVSFLMVMPVVFGSVRAGLASRDPALLEVARVFHLSPARRLFAVEAPAVLPHFASGCRTALGLAWKAGVAAEVLCMPRATIGLKLYEAKLYIETVDVFAWTLVIVLLSLLLEGAMNALFAAYKTRLGGVRSNAVSA